MVSLGLKYRPFMNLQKLLLPTAIVAIASLAVAADDDNPIKKSMRAAHKAPQGEKKLCEKIVGGTASDEEVKSVLDGYKAMVDCKPPRGEQAAFKEKVTKLIAATENVVAKKEGAAAEYKAAVSCKACHTDHKPEEKKP